MHTENGVPKLISGSLLRRFHLINVSLQKTGTKSIAGIFNRFRSAHEYQHDAATEALHRYYSGSLDRNDLRAFLLARDAMGQLEVDSASFNGWFADFYVEMFPQARFLIVLREPIEWLDSVLTHIQRDVRAAASRKVAYPLRFMRQAEIAIGQFSPDIFQTEDTLSEALPLLSKQLLTHWQNQTSTVLECVPTNRRLILSTSQLSTSLTRLAEFAGISQDRINSSSSHLHKRPDSTKVLQKCGLNIAPPEILRQWDTWKAFLL